MDEIEKLWREVKQISEEIGRLQQAIDTCHDPKEAKELIRQRNTMQMQTVFYMMKIRNLQDQALGAESSANDE